MNTIDAVGEPLAITMWDSSWLRRRYRGGGFEDWDRALGELVDRGYNAVRIDAFPHLVAAGPDGRLVERFKDVPNQFPSFYGFAMWGTQWTQYIEPRKALIEFLAACRDHKVKVALSTWFKPTDDGRNDQIEGLDGFVRVWEETLRLVEEAGLMETVVYLDVLNEFPMGHCFTWLHRQAATMLSPVLPDGSYNDRQRDFLWSFLNQAIDRLRAGWPELAISASFTLEGFDSYWCDEDLSNLDLLDVHIWINQNEEFAASSDYETTIRRHGNPDGLFTVEAGTNAYVSSPRLIPADYHYDRTYADLLHAWRSRTPEWRTWFESTIARVASTARASGLPVGQTEGWGLVNWLDHPLLGWEIHRDTAQIAAEIGARQGYAFNCSANFCHPHFVGFWENVEWHRGVTDVIRGR